MSYVFKETLVASDLRTYYKILEYDRINISEEIDIKKNKRIKRV